MMNYFWKGLARVILGAAFIAVSISAVAETVTRREALRLAQTFFNAAHRQVMGKPDYVYNGKELTTDRLFSPFYVFNLPAGGFVIISAENKAMPILGYSLKDRFNPDKIGRVAKALLAEYARDIEYIRYDSRVPEEAIAAWTDYNSYVAELLSARYDVAEPGITSEDAKEIVSNIVTTGRIEELSSDIFTPMQWRDLVAEELSVSECVVLGVAAGDKLVPAIVHGRKGDYFQMMLDGENSWLMRLMATEFLSSGQVAELTNTPVYEEVIEEDRPFTLYDEFIAETRAEQERRQADFEERLNHTEPVVRSIGGGHFEVVLPEDVKMARIYNLQGAQVETFTFRSTNTAVLKLDAEPRGFYFALLNGVSGKPYGFKLYK